jgi:tRNA threonylcarbamoyladenosine biosynthesis protein TsaE
LITQSERETEEIGERLAATLEDSDVVYLIGDLGAGKTCFARGLARGRGAPERQVASPTFSIVHEYAGSSGEIVLRHIDLYRLKDTLAELEILGLPDSISGAPVVVEWPGQAIQQIVPSTIRVLIDQQPDGARAIRIDRGELRAES